VLQDLKGDWKKLGAGSFGNVYKGESNKFDVHGERHLMNMFAWLV
jgi:hypothetical protein